MGGRTWLSTPVVQKHIFWTSASGDYRLKWTTYESMAETTVEFDNRIDIDWTRTVEHIRLFHNGEPVAHALAVVNW